MQLVYAGLADIDLEVVLLVPGLVADAIGLRVSDPAEMTYCVCLCFSCC